GGDPTSGRGQAERVSRGKAPQQLGALTGDYLVAGGGGVDGGVDGGGVAGAAGAAGLAFLSVSTDAWRIFWPSPTFVLTTLMLAGSAESTAACESAMAFFAPS